MRFSVTELGTHDRCERRAVLSSKNGMHLTPLSTPLNFATGSMWHRAHQLWITDPNTQLSFHALTAGVEAAEKVKANYQRVVGTAPSNDELSTTYEAVEFVTAMCDNYAIRYGTPLPPGYNFLSAEQKISVQVPSTEHACEAIGCFYGKLAGLEVICATCMGTGIGLHTLEGRLDALIQHVATGRVDPLERKTYDKRPAENSLLYNHQFMGYRWLVAQLNLSPLTPHVLYDGAWRRATTPRGRTFDDLFMRLDLTCSQAQLDEFGHHLPRQLNEMAALYTHPKPLANARPHRPWMGCIDCKAFEKLCISITRNEDYQQLIDTSYTQRTDDVEAEAEEVPA